MNLAETSPMQYAMEIKAKCPVHLQLSWLLEIRHFTCEDVPETGMALLGPFHAFVHIFCCNWYFENVIHFRCAVKSSYLKVKGTKENIWDIQRLEISRVKVAGTTISLSNPWYSIYMYLCSRHQSSFVS
jgi:hypothetical protein